MAVNLDSAAKSSRAVLIVPAPSAPMAVARAVVRALYQSPHGARLRFHRGVPHIWDGTCWPEIAIRDVRSAAYHYLEDARYLDDKGELLWWKPNRHKLDNLLDALQALTLIESRRESPLWVDHRDQDLPAVEIVSMQNGLLHVPTRTLLPHTPRFFGHHSLPFAFLPEAPAPSRWLEFLSELWPEDESSIMALQETMGYLLAGGTNLQKIFLMVGQKRGGKGTIARVLSGLLGTHNVAAPTLSSLATNFGLAPLIGKPLAIVADARMSPRTESHIVVERLLSISGEDSLTVDRKYRDPWTGRLRTRFLILTNELPRLTDASGALTSRFILFVLTKSFYGAENTRLTEELLAEASSIFIWALIGLDRLLARGYFVQPNSGQEAIQRLDDLASPIGAFLRARCITTPDSRIACDELWHVYKSWCESENRPPGTRAVFGRDLHAALPTIRRVRAREGQDRYYDYVGIGISLANSVDHIAGDLGPLGPIHGGGPRGPRPQALRVRDDEDGDEVTDGRF